MDKKKLSKLSLEETFDSIDDILNKMSNDDMPLEESFALYKDGMELIGHCSGIIDEVEKQIIILQKEEDSEEDDEL